MDIYDKMCFTVSSAGGRRGAQMGTFDIGHPDVLEFIRAKRENGRLRQFNLSLLITDEFMQAVKSDGEWKLAFPLRQKEFDAESADLEDATRNSSGANGRIPRDMSPMRKGWSRARSTRRCPPAAYGT